MGMLDESLSVLNPLSVTAYAASLIGCLLLTTQNRDALTPLRAVLVVACALYLGVVTLVLTQGNHASEIVSFAAYLVSFMIPRGNIVAGALGSGLLIGYLLVWGALHDLSGGEFASLVGVPIGCVAAAIAWRLWLRTFVRRERHHRSAAAQAAERAAASIEAIRVSQRELTEIREEVAPTLEQIVQGVAIDEDMRVALVRAEAAVRDRIRAPHLQHPELLATFARLRDHEVTVVVLGEPSVGTAIAESLARAIVELVGDVTDGRVTVRTLPPGRASAVSIVIQSPGRSEQIALSAIGEVVSRG